MRIWVIHSIWLEREFAPWILAFFKLESGGVIFRRFAGTWRTGVSMSGQPNSGRKDGTTLHLLYLSSPKQGFSCGFREAENTSSRQQQLMRTREEDSPLWSRRRRATRVCLQWAPTKWWPGQTSEGSRLAERGTKPQIGAIAVHHEEIANLLYCCPHPNFSLSLWWSWRERRYFSYNLPFLFLLAQFSVSCWHRLAWLSSTTPP